MSGGSTALARLRAEIQKDETQVRERIGKGLKRKDYWKACGELLRIRAILTQIADMIKTENSGVADGGSTED